MSTLKHIETLQAAAIALEDRMRKSGLYAADCKSLEELSRRGNRRGVALLFDEQGVLDEVVSLNGGDAFVEVSNEGNKVQVAHSFPDYSTINIKGSRSEQHRDNTRRMSEEASAKPYALATAEKHATADAAKLAAEKKATQDRNTAIAKREYQAGIERTTLIAARMKEASAKIHK
jgi:hypothetical protein